MAGQVWGVATSTNLGVAWPAGQIAASQVKSGQILCPIFFQSMQYGRRRNTGQVKSCRIPITWELQYSSTLNQNMGQFYCVPSQAGL